jgi:hypothetical protein
MEQMHTPKIECIGRVKGALQKPAFWQVCRHLVPAAFLFLCMMVLYGLPVFILVDFRCCYAVVAVLLWWRRAAIVASFRWRCAGAGLLKILCIQRLFIYHKAIDVRPVMF